MICIITNIQRKERNCFVRKKNHMKGEAFIFKERNEGVELPSGRVNCPPHIVL